MTQRPELYAQVDAKGRLILPGELTARFGLKKGDSLPIIAGQHEFRLRQPVGLLAKLYIEPTNQCNLNCRTCMRSVWDEPPGGQMDGRTFKRIIRGIKTITPRPHVVFGGLGEPLSHPDLCRMVAAIKQEGCPVELITNATMLDSDRGGGLVSAGLDSIWVSLDGARPESYADVRLGAALPEVIDNIARFRDIRQGSRPRIGIVFVAMRRNMAELPDVIALGRRLGADRFLVTNVLPYTEDMGDQILYGDVLQAAPADEATPLSPHLHVCSMDMRPETAVPLYRIMRGSRIANTDSGMQAAAHNYCPFIESGSLAIAWDGGVSPCVPLMHSHRSFLNGRKRFSERYIVGNINDRMLSGLWHLPEHRSFRAKVKNFDFSPCSLCGGCRLSAFNHEDCLGNTFPTCGGCLWAQGVVRCP